MKTIHNIENKIFILYDKTINPNKAINHSPALKEYKDAEIRSFYVSAKMGFNIDREYKSNIILWRLKKNKE